MPLRDFHCRLCRIRRKEKGWTQSQLAEKSKVSVDTIKKYEKGGNITLETYLMIEDAFSLNEPSLIISDKTSNHELLRLSSTILEFLTKRLAE